MTTRLEGSAALVTGGASGLGHAVARMLHERGARVVVLDLPQAIAGLPRSEGMLPLGADVRDEEAVAAAVATANEAGALRVCVNCAGIATPARILRHGAPLPLEDFRRMVEVNLVGSFNVVRLAAAAMAKNEPVSGERGVIVNTASVAAFEGQVGQVAYAASKGGIAAMTLPIARDLADSLIRCVTIAPGMFETPLLQVLPPQARASLAEAVPHPRRLGAPTEFAALVGHVVDNAMLNGETIRLDGALRMAPR